MTSFIAAGGSGRSTSVIPAVPAASSVTTIAFIWTPLYQPSPTRHLRFTTASPTPNVGVLSTQIAWHPIPRSVYLTVHRADTWTAGPRHVFSATGGLDPSSPTSD